MQGVLNEWEFTNPRRLRRWIMRAGGWADANAAHEGGIWMPLEVKLRAGQYLYRIGHSRGARGPVPDEVNLTSPWWLDGEAIADISISATMTGIPGQRIARLKLSVSERYGLFDTVFCVRLKAPLGALSGLGNPVYDPPEPGSLDAPPVWAWSGPRIRQYFIPGLRDLHNRPSGLAMQAFQLIGTRPAHSWLSTDSGPFVGHG